MISRLPKNLHWLFWSVDPTALDVRQDADPIIARIVEFGGLSEVRWMLRRYGRERVHTFFRDVGDNELSRRTVSFWRCYLGAKDEKWAQVAPWRKAWREANAELSRH